MKMKFFVTTDKTVSKDTGSYEIRMYRPGDDESRLYRRGLNRTYALRLCNHLNTNYKEISE